MRVFCALLVLVGLRDQQDWHTGNASRSWTRYVLLLLASYALSTVAVRGLGAAALNTAVVEDAKIALYFALSAGLIAACSSERIRHAIVLAVILTGFAVIALSVMTFVSFANLNFTYDDIRAAKFVLSEHYGIVLNSTVHLGFLGLILFWVMDVGRFAKVAATIFVLGFAAITTTRTPIGALFVSFAVLAGVYFFRKTTVRQRLAAALVIIGLPIVYLFSLDTSGLVRLGVSIDNALAGRAELWLVASQSFLNDPIFGSGPGSWSMIVPRFALRIAPLFTGKLDEALSLTTGGYHNTFVTALAERGIVGLSVLLLAFAFILKSSFRLKASPAAFRGDFDKRVVAVLPLLWIYMSVRGLFEESGLFGRANSDVDFVSLVLLALTLAYANNLDAVHDPRPGAEYR
ncbi:MAG TPA: O-antigen ligase family protein [Rhizomicrobium sp.]|nr:O-antigen ligase family protein [Rhizomicrobium sp.]